MESCQQNSNNHLTLTPLLEEITGNVGKSCDLMTLLLQIFEANELLGPIEYSRQVIRLIQPFISIVEVEALKKIEEFRETVTTRRLLSGQVYVFKTVQCCNQKSEVGGVNRDAQIEELEYTYGGRFVEELSQPLRSLESTQLLYVSKNTCKVLVIELSEEAREVMEKRYDTIRIYLHSYFQGLVGSRQETSKHIQHFKRESRNYRQSLPLGDKVYFVEEGVVEVLNQHSQVTVELEKGSVVGLQKYFCLSSKQVYRVKSRRMTAYTIEYSHIECLGDRWVNHLYIQTKETTKRRNKHILEQRKTDYSNRKDNVFAIETFCNIRKRGLTQYQESMEGVLAKMHPLQQSIVVNFTRSKRMKSVFPKVNKADMLLNRLKEASQFRRFNPYKNLKMQISSVSGPSSCNNSLMGPMSSLGRHESSVKQFSRTLKGRYFG